MRRIIKDYRNNIRVNKIEKYPSNYSIHKIFVVSEGGYIF